MFSQFTLGIEEEFQIVDPQTRELRSHVSEFLEEGKMLLGEQIKPEMIQSMVEVGTGICNNIQEARADITRLRSIISGLAAKTGLRIVAASSPFWMGHNTRLKSYRSESFRKFPRTDLPDHFDSYGSFQRYVDLLVKTGCVNDGKKIWWDLRPHPVFPTLEFRICDIPTRVDDTVAIAALFQAIVAKLTKLIDKNLGFRLYRRMLIQENKWRAVRWGLDGKMIDFGKQKEVPTKDLVRELLDFVDDVLDDLGSRKGVEHIHTILDRGTSADEQLRVYQETNDLKAVVDRLMELTLENVPRDVNLTVGHAATAPSAIAK